MRPSADREDGAQGWEGRGRAKGRGREAGMPRSRRSRRCGVSPPASSRCRRTTPTTTNPLPIDNIDPDFGALIPVQPPQLPRQPFPRLHGDAPHDPALAWREQ